MQPLVVEEPPQQLSTGEYVAKLEAGDAGVPDVTRPLSGESIAFLAGAAPADRVLLLLGEAGSGKSMFTWLTAVDHMVAFEALASNVGGGGGRVTVAVKTALALE